VLRLAGDADAFRRMQRTGNPFGDGHAAERIVTTLTTHFARTSLVTVTRQPSPAFA
jgi:UDP-N-acetylglucosamine 2-epimerase